MQESRGGANAYQFAFKAIVVHFSSHGSRAARLKSNNAESVWARVTLPGAEQDSALFFSVISLSKQFYVDVKRH